MVRGKYKAHTWLEVKSNLSWTLPLSLCSGSFLQAEFWVNRQASDFSPGHTQRQFHTIMHFKAVALPWLSTIPNMFTLYLCIRDFPSIVFIYIIIVFMFFFFTDVWKGGYQCQSAYMKNVSQDLLWYISMVTLESYSLHKVFTED